MEMLMAVIRLEQGVHKAAERQQFFFRKYPDIMSVCGWNVQKTIILDVARIGPYPYVHCSCVSARFLFTRFLDDFEKFVGSQRCKYL